MSERNGASPEKLWTDDDTDDEGSYIYEGSDAPGEAGATNEAPSRKIEVAGAAVQEQAQQEPRPDLKALAIYQQSWRDSLVALVTIVAIINVVGPAMADGKNVDLALQFKMPGVVRPWSLSASKSNNHESCLLESDDAQTLAEVKAAEVHCAESAQMVQDGLVLGPVEEPAYAACVRRTIISNATMLKIDCLRMSKWSEGFLTDAKVVSGRPPCLDI